MKKLLALLLLAACLLSLASCKKDPGREVAGFLFTDKATFDYYYRFHRYVDLENGKIWNLEGVPRGRNPYWKDWGAREFPGEDPAANGFSLVCDLSPESVEKIQQACGQCHMPDWDEYYEGPARVEGYWYLTIVYKDGTTQPVEGWPTAYPEGLDKLAEAILEETGLHIFRKEMDPATK